MDRATRRLLAAKLFADGAACSRDGDSITREGFGPTERGALAVVEGFAPGVRTDDGARRGAASRRRHSRRSVRRRDRDRRQRSVLVFFMVAFEQ